jgi:hypothetical protein
LVVIGGWEFRPTLRADVLLSNVNVRRNGIAGAACNLPDIWVKRLPSAIKAKPPMRNATRVALCHAFLLLFACSNDSSTPAGPDDDSPIAGTPFLGANASLKSATRFTCPITRRAYVSPARHFASSRTDSNLPPMGMRVRLRKDFDVSSYPSEVQVILNAMKRYGMLLADNGTGWFVSGAPDPRWNDENLGALKRVGSQNFEVVRMGEVITAVAKTP